MNRIFYCLRAIAPEDLPAKRMLQEDGSRVLVPASDADLLDMGMMRLSDTEPFSLFDCLEPRATDPRDRGVVIYYPVGATFPGTVLSEGKKWFPRPDRYSECPPEWRTWAFGCVVGEPIDPAFDLQAAVFEEAGGSLYPGEPCLAVLRDTYPTDDEILAATAGDAILTVLMARVKTEEPTARITRKALAEIGPFDVLVERDIPRHLWSGEQS